MSVDIKKSYPILKCSHKKDILTCASIIRAGGVAVFPTDTVYGVGCTPYNARSVERILEIKGRRDGKPLPVIASSVRDIQKIARLGKVGMLLAQNYWPGALTIISPLRENTLSQLITAGKDSIAVRIPGNNCVLSLLKYCKYLVGTSANLSATAAPKSSSEVLTSSFSGFDALLDDGETEYARESTIIDLTAGKVKLVREGAIESAKIFKLIKEAWSSE